MLKDYKEHLPGYAKDYERLFSEEDMKKLDDVNTDLLGIECDRKSEEKYGRDAVIPQPYAGL